jgi:hypothetical protein
MQIIKNGKFEEERALYGSKELRLINCGFDGDLDGESALKESSDIIAEECFFNLRYPFWHVDRLSLDNCEMTELCRAALWYSDGITVKNSRLHGIKALRECRNICISDSSIKSPEFGWFSKNVKIQDSDASGEYFMFKGEEIRMSGVSFTGKYSFQYISNSVFENCVIDTKDAFWHARDVVVKNSVVKGEYLAWYSENVTFENCVIYGTQPLCYCKGLRLLNCEMHGADLAFELSEVDATLTSPIISIKNPIKGRISLPAVDEIINDVKEASCVIDVG